MPCQRFTRCFISLGVVLLTFCLQCFRAIAIVVVIEHCTPRMLAVLSAVLAFSLLCCVASLSNVTGPHSLLALLSCHCFWRSLTCWFSSVCCCFFSPALLFVFLAGAVAVVATCVRLLYLFFVGTLCGRCCQSECCSLLEFQNAKADMCNDVFLELLLPPACHPVLGECTSGGKMYTINIFVKYASCLVVLQYLQCDSSGYHPPWY